jgi:hypothetical protein
MFGSTTRATSGGQPCIGTTDTDLTWREREHEQVMWAADRRRHAAYRRLALTVLGLDVQTLVQTLPLTGKESDDLDREGAA